MIDHGRLTDDDVAAMVAEWVGDVVVVRARAPEGGHPAAAIIENMTTLADLRDLSLLAGGVGSDGTRATDAGGYTVEGDDVFVWDGGEDQVTVSRAAFTDLMARLLAVALKHHVGDDDVWAELAAHAEAIGA